MTVLSLTDCVLAWESGSPEETVRAGEALGRLLRPGDVVALFGDLGSGKTVLVRGIAAGLGVAPEAVHSPSFTLVNEYTGDRRQDSAGRSRPCRLAHVDLYRIRSEEEIPGIGWDEYLGSRYVLTVEWAERALGWLPQDHLRVTLEVGEADRRRLHMQATGPRSARLVRDWVASAGVAVQAA